MMNNGNKNHSQKQILTCCTVNLDFIVLLNLSMADRCSLQIVYENTLIHNDHDFGSIKVYEKKLNRW